MELSDGEEEKVDTDLVQQDVTNPTANERQQAGAVGVRFVDSEVSNGHC